MPKGYAYVRRVHKILMLVLALSLTWAVPMPAFGQVTPLPIGTDVDYQLGGAVDRPETVGIIARDRTEDPAAGRYNICYVNGYQTQPNEKRFWLRHHPGLLLKKNDKPVVDENWGEFLLDIRTPEKRRQLAAIVGGWIAGCADDGFQAVELDNLDSFSRSHRLIARADAAD